MNGSKQIIVNGQTLENAANLGPSYISFPGSFILKEKENGIWRFPNKTFSHCIVPNVPATKMENGT